LALGYFTAVFGMGTGVKDPAITTRSAKCSMFFEKLDFFDVLTLTRLTPLRSGRGGA
tara:strand:- start:181 stop:351 length:171 start_codon:yes stop_codon:yes gene_type:complete